MASVDLRTNSLRPAARGDDMDPMASLANLADVMLVFACGLMLSLITYWNIDVSAISEVIPESKVSEIENPEDIPNQLQTPEGNAYLDMGRVYMDPTTGKYYMVADAGSAQEELIEEDIEAQNGEGAQESSGDDSGQGNVVPEPETVQGRGSEEGAVNPEGD